MNLTAFRESLSEQAPPAHLNTYAEALWWDAKGAWEKAHELIQDRPDKNAAWVHAYLHRKEGDTWNADYWYTRAGKKRQQISLEEEWNSIVEAML
ncbi:MAG TPA: hypothetical protein VGN63_24480 [Flavisolibacter sp.]|jgi:hypothetical protein|nr:hypothetical protein [Flavisolibacter sp.]